MLIDYGCLLKRRVMETKYLLVLWPESQSFIGVKDCYYVSIDDEEDIVK